MRGLHPLIATLIIIAVALAVTVAAASLVLGYFHSTQKRAAAVLRIYNATMYLYRNGTCLLEALLKPEGGEVQIVRIRVDPYGQLANYTIEPEPVNGDTLKPGVLYRLTAVISGCSIERGTSGRIWVESVTGAEYVGFYTVVVKG